jgi:phosphoribosyl-ATP pyrophosphohydrolase
MITYSEMVRKLAKSGESALASLTPERVHVWHMSSCLMGEAGELMGGHLDQENVLEELGDLEFYIEGLREGLNIRFDHVCDQIVDVKDTCHFNYLVGISIESCNIFDCCKKWFIYEKDLDRKKLVEAMARFEFYMACFRGSRDIRRDDVLVANMNKLAKRYGAKYEYSNAKAQNRADKQS